MITFIKLLHLAAGIAWLGGMAFMLFALRPALLTQLEGAARLTFLAQVLQRFFAIVLGAVALLLLTGLHLYGAGAKAVGMSSIPLGWHLMAGLGITMILLFGLIYFAGFRGLKRAVEAANWPVAAAKAAQIHSLVVANFLLGCAAVIAVRML
ncbi:MAG: CopD family protein [Brachymonas sp.]